MNRKGGEAVSHPSTVPPPEEAPPLRNRFDRSEWAGAFGDLGTLIPFVIGYITVMKLDPLGILFMFGILLITCGAYYKTPIPVQPMKAIGAAAITSQAVTPGMVCGAGLFTGIFWLTMGLTNTINLVAKITTKPIVRGIVLGLGFLFIRDGIRMMSSDWIIALLALLVTFFMLGNKKIPAMFALLVIGIVVAFVKDPGLWSRLAAVDVGLKLPHFALKDLTWRDFLMGSIILGIPQIPLTLGNAVIAVTAENNRLFPNRPVTEKKVAISQGIMNLISPIGGGIPMCHGAGGMAGHVRFGAHTGGATMILGCLLLATALFLSDSVLLIFRMFPENILGVILFFAGLELAVSARDVPREKNDFYVFLITAGFAIWNMGAGFLAGVIADQLTKRNLIKL
ncbi:MAG: sulfate transporter [Ammonifex sp.]|nr:MAG: sulfate transporter [Ammonifex sp.]